MSEKQTKLHETLSQEQLLALKQRLQGKNTSNKQKIERLEKRDYINASYAQERLWFLSQLVPDNPFYNVASSYRISGNLKVEQLEKAFNKMIARHEVLRTGFAFKNGKPLQVIRDEVKFVIPVDDLSLLNEAEQSIEIQKQLDKEATLAFNLEEDLLIRARLLRLGSREYILMLTLHHIISDARSQNIIAQELQAFYAGNFDRPELAVQYIDYTVWQKQYLQGKTLEKLLNYWRTQLADLPSALELPTDYVRPSILSYKGARYPIQALSATTSQGLKTLCQEQSATLFMGMLAAFKIMFSQYTNSSDIVVGSPIAGRNRPEVQELIGFFVNTLALRSSIQNTMSFRQILDRVRQTCLEAFEHQDLPFEKLVEELQPERYLNSNPIIQVTFQLLNRSDRNIQLEDLQVDKIPLAGYTTRFDLSIDMVEVDDIVDGTIIYSTDIFAEATIARLAAYYHHLLTCLVEAPDVPIGLLNFIPIEQANMLQEWNMSSNASKSNFSNLVDWFENQVAQTPKKTAVINGNESLSYRELDNRANQVAHQLQNLGVGPNVLVSVCLSRSLDMIVALLGVLKAGGAYLPFDPNYPAERLNYMLQDSKSTILLTTYDTEITFSTGDINILYLDEPSFWEDVPTLAPLRNWSGNSTAYVIYTSGSTGHPKGVMVPHQNVVDLFSSTHHWTCFSDEDVWTLFHSYAFDFSVWEIWGALLYGGSLVIVPFWMARSPEDFFNLIFVEGVTILNQTPSAFRELVRASQTLGESVAHSDLRMVIFGGEALDVSIVEPWMHDNDQIEFVNMYGITETTVHVTYHHLNATHIKEKSKSVGRPIDNVSIYILDANYNLVPLGAVGEMFVGGIGVSQGYLNRPELTAQRFIPHPFSNIEGARLYRTGDLARFLPNGELEFIGRNDSQVKLRGFRIELGEIEVVLRQNTNVSDAVVALQTGTNNPNDAHLVAYVVPRWGVEEFQQSNSDLKNQWQDVFNNVYHEEVADAEFNFSGWNNSYDSQAIPAEEMREWQQLTVDAIRRLNPKRVLEIGCGTGLLLWHLAPYSQEYVATDFSKTSIKLIEEQLTSNNLPQVSLHLQEATVFENLSKKHFDTVIINSVMQYFPDMDYLLKVIDGAIDSIGSQGKIFIGDVRNLNWQEYLYTSIELAKSNRESKAQSILQRVKYNIASEDELVTAPEFFRLLKKRNPRISYVEILPKMGHFNNEMNRFRYDVVLYIGNNWSPIEISSWFHWTADNLNESIIQDLVRSQSGTTIGIRGVPYGRILPEKWAWDKINSSENDFSSAGVIADSLGKVAKSPEFVKWDWLQEIPKKVYFSLQKADTIDIAILPNELDTATKVFDLEEEYLQSLDTYINNPTTNQLIRRANLDLINTLKRNTRDNLPAFMVPSNILILPALPLTSNGKLDYKALQSFSDLSVRTNNDDNSDWTTPELEIVANIWCSVLGLSHVQAKDNFFEIGGHSLLATQIIARVRETFLIDISLREIFESPSLEEFTRVIIQSKRKSIKQAITSVERDSLMPLSFAQERLWFLNQLVPNSAFYNIASVFEVFGSLNIGRLEEAFNKIVARHEILRTTFLLSNQLPFQVIHEAMPINIVVDDLSPLDEAKQAKHINEIMLEEATQFFDLEKGPLVKVRVLHVNAGKHFILITLHHIISDAWSQSIIARELEIFYGNGPKPSVPKLQYIDFTAWQRGQLQGEILERLLQYWRGKLDNAPFVMELPRDYERPSITSYQGARYPIPALPDITVQRLQELSQSHAVSLFMALLAAFKIMLFHYTGNDDILVGTPIAGRSHQETEEILGFFVNTLVLRTNISGEMSFKQILNKVRQTCLDAYNHQDLPFEKLVEELQPERDLSRNPLIQVLFQVINTPNRNIKLDNLTIDNIETTTQTSKFDLEVQMYLKQESLIGTVIYSTDLYKEESIARFVAYYRNIIELLAEKPDVPVSQLSILTTDEQRHILSLLNSETKLKQLNLKLADWFENLTKLDANTWRMVRQLSDVRYYILNKNKQLQVIGADGELYLGGLDIAYSEQASLVAAGFLPDPYTTSSKALMYGTGIRVKLLSDGALEFLDAIQTKLLEASEQRIDEEMTEYTAPRTYFERWIANVWESILHVDEISLEDNFFELGGHSLLATRVILNLREALSANIPLQLIFEYPELGKFARKLQDELGLGGDAAEEIARLVMGVDSADSV